MAYKLPSQKVWKQTPSLITLEPFDHVISEIHENTTWTKETIAEQLLSEKKLIRLPEAKYHIYRDCLG